ncbi:hypothetical protein [Pyrobaculum aerophilum]|uniref:Uncharacterized protein n=2 Tax=Pyrobaculum aerophilum TaxID=13773 RepID=Q8ZTZ4_PYRAE|nr:MULTISPECIES: hypothetical protein [Pyrobaculum]AAL64615.1 hypothetical protein PAE3017 [Pyrobaculum aerophilum str. IM2]MCX8137400.1 hypothetical protein [Pyrobaculum aerophilum]
MAPKNMPLITALVVVVVFAVATGTNVFKATLLYENGFVKVVGPNNKTFTAKLYVKGEETKRVEIKLLPNGSAVMLDGGRPWVVIKHIKMVGGEVKRVELKLLPNDTLLVINGSEILSKVKIEKKAGQSQLTRLRQRRSQAQS